MMQKTVLFFFFKSILGGGVGGVVLGFELGLELASLVLYHLSYSVNLLT
jgi:hypothetical protein